MAYPGILSEINGGKLTDAKGLFIVPKTRTDTWLGKLKDHGGSVTVRKRADAIDFLLNQRLVQYPEAGAFEFMATSDSENPPAGFSRDDFAKETPLIDDTRYTGPFIVAYHPVRRAPGSDSSDNDGQSGRHTGNRSGGRREGRRIHRRIAGLRHIIHARKSLTFRPAASSVFIFPMKLGLTGGIGCGKSTFGKMLADRGWRLVQTDLVARDILETPEVTARVRELFGAGVVGADGKPDRAAIGKIVFADKAALAALEGELHPRVRAHWESLLKSRPEARWVVEIPLLFEKSLDAPFDFTVCVHCSQAVQLARLASRGVPPEEASARMKAQLPVSDKVRRATLAVFNEGNLPFLAAQADTLDSRFPAHGTR